MTSGFRSVTVQTAKPAHSEDKRKANKLLQRRLGEIGIGAFVGPDLDKTTVEELANDYLRDYRINAKKSIEHGVSLD